MSVCLYAYLHPVSAQCLPDCLNACQTASVIHSIALMHAKLLLATLVLWLPNCLPAYAMYVFLANGLNVSVPAYIYECLHF
jgi:hypothetical protein